MPTGIIMQSSSQGAKAEDIEKVLVANGYEADKPEVKEETEPARDQFDSDESWEAAKAEFDRKQEEAEDAAEEEAERVAAKKPVAKLSRRERAVQAATKELREQNRKLEERLAALEGKKPEAKVEEPKAPKREDFKSDQEFDDAMFDYRYQMRRQKEQAEEAKKSLEKRLAQNFEEYKDSVAAFKEEHDDWDEVVNSKLSISEAVYFAIVDLGKEGPAVTYHLGQHPEILEELAELTPYRAAIEVGRLADKLNGKTPSAERKPKPKAATIPEPVKPISSSASASTLTTREAAQKRDYRAFKAAQRRGA